MFSDLFKSHGRQGRRVLHKALGSCCALAAGAALAYSGAAPAGASATTHPTTHTTSHKAGSGDASPLGHRPVPGEPRIRAATFFPDTWILNDYGYLCLEAENDSSDNPNNAGDPVRLHACGGTSNFYWNINQGTGSYGTITSFYGNNLCLQAENDSSSNPFQDGDPVELWPCDGDGEQLWKFVMKTDDGFFQVINGDAYLSLDAEADSNGNPTQNGDKADVSSWNGGTNQLWTY